jgi:hypothetical protein
MEQRYEKIGSSWNRVGIFAWKMPETCEFPRLFAFRAGLEIAMILDGEN